MVYDDPFPSSTLVFLLLFFFFLVFSFGLFFIPKGNFDWRWLRLCIQHRNITWNWSTHPLLLLLQEFFQNLLELIHFGVFHDLEMSSLLEQFRTAFLLAYRSFWLRMNEISVLESIYTQVTDGKVKILFNTPAESFFIAKMITLTNRFYWCKASSYVSNGTINKLNRFLPSFTGFYLVLLGFTEFHRVLPGFT